MLLLTLILMPLYGIFLIISQFSYSKTDEYENLKLKTISLAVTIIDLIISLVIWLLFNNTNKHFQFVQEHYVIGYYDFYLGIDGLSIYFVLLTTLIMPIAIISNWKSIDNKVKYFLIIMLLLETLLLMIFLVLDLLMFYIFFESILAPLFLLIGIFGSSAKIRASFYFFLYTFLGSLFMLLSIITMQSLIGCTDMNVLLKTNFIYITQLFIFIGIFIAFAVKTPTIYLNSWLLKAHVESPLSGSIILAAIVLKLSLYGIFRLILPLVPKAFLYYTYIVFLIGVLTIIYASLSTLRTIDVKELIAYSSVSHAAVYLSGVFSNTIQGIQGGILLGLAHGFVSSGLFISAGGILYDRSGTRLITYYRGIAQIMPIFSILFFILSLGNCGSPLTLNFIGEFMSLYGIFERIPVAGVLASSSIVLSAAYTIFMFNRIAFGGSIFPRYWEEYIPDLNRREFFMLIILVIFTILLGIYPSIVLDGLHYYVYNLLYSIYFK
jgi:NADH-ubiquinone oxidoreductase chain 4